MTISITEKSAAYRLGYSDGLSSNDRGYLDLPAKDLTVSLEEWIEGYQHGQFVLLSQIEPKTEG